MSKFLLQHRGAVVQVFRGPDAKWSLGTGFLTTADGHILTCWHVVETNRGEMPEQVFVRFSDQGRIRRAEVLPDHGDKELDYIVVKAEGHVAAEPIPIGIADSSGDFSSFGYRKSEFADGLVASGIIQGDIKLKRKVPRIQLESGNIEGGMSGAPVWSQSAEKVVGLISERFVSSSTTVDKGLAVAVPIGEILKKEGRRGKSVGLFQRTIRKVDNPFPQHGPIMTAEHFVGRETEIQSICKHVDQWRNVSIVGAPQSGKSSLLRRIFEKYRDDDGAKVIYVDFHRILDLKQFFDWCGRQAFGKPMDNAEFDGAIDPHKLVLLIDDYHRVLTIKRGNHVATYVRGLGQSPEKAVVVTSLLPMDQIFPPEEWGKSNPGTYYDEQRMTGLSFADADDLAGRYLKGTDVAFTRQEIRAIHERTGGAPYALQREFARLFDEKIGGAD